jgi:DNA invertase Pin-like site-specific DNA recombinase
MAKGRFISYLRVSTAKQGRSGLGIEAQRHAVESYLNGGKWELLAEYVEQESGGNNDRPKLAAALHHAKVTGATLLIAKLDRLSRDLAFIANLQKAQAKFVCCDMPEANELTIHLMAALAQHERKLIGQRTREAMAAAKRRGKRFGNPNGARALEGVGNDAAVVKIKERADEFAKDIISIVRDIQDNGITSLVGIAQELEKRGIKTARGGQWHASTVYNLLERMR